MFLYCRFNDICDSDVLKYLLRFMDVLENKTSIQKQTMT